MSPFSGGQAQDIVDAVRAQVVVRIFTVDVVIEDVTATHKEVAAFHTPAHKEAGDIIGYVVGGCHTIAC